ncbi:MAG: ATP-binding protein [Chloroflexota bacterium]|nr:ATP-binding protein [Aggregatilineaceae bacterium]
MTVEEVLRRAPAFAALPDDQFAQLMRLGREMTVPKDTVVIEEGADAPGLYVLVEGEMTVTKRIRGRSVTLNRLEPVTFAGEISVMTGLRPMATVRTLTDTRLLFFDIGLFREILTNSPLISILLSTMAARLRGMEGVVRQEEKLAALGRLSAGLAHELNNPAAAAMRAARQLPDVLLRLQSLVFGLNELGLSAEQLAFLNERQGELIQRATRPDRLDPLERADREEAVASWIEAQGVPDAWQLAPMLVRAQFTVSELEPLKSMFEGPALGHALAWLEGMISVGDVLNAVAESTERIHGLVTAIKAYTYMDRSPVQEVDIHQGLDNTLTMLAHKLRAIEVIREYDPALPRITAHGSQLNQVWTNLIDNAIDALGGQGHIWIRTMRERDHIVVEIADDGPGIPLEVQSRIFEPFFTTKGVGDGTGMGLETAHRIVVEDHRGDLQVISKPGDTRFLVYLPLNSSED